MNVEAINHMNDNDLLNFERELITNHDYRLVPLLETLDFIFKERFGRNFGELKEIPYDVEITETLQKSIRVIATSQQEAIKAVKDRYLNGQIVLSADDYSDYDLECINDLRNNLEIIRSLFK